MSVENYSEKKKKSSHIYHMIQLILFFGILFAGCIIGFLMPLRPQTSDVEKRPLTKLPHLNEESFLSGSFFKDMDTWYADTYPFRDVLLSANSSIKELYGIRTEQIHGTVNGKDEIPTIGAVETEEKKTGESKDGKETSGTKETSDVKEKTNSQNSSESSKEINESSTAAPPNSGGKVDDGLEPQVHGVIYQEGTKAYGMYYFNLNAASTYIKSVNRVAEGLKGIANVYDMMIPNNSGVLLNKETLEKLGASDQRDAVNYYQSSMSKEVKKIEVFDALVAHKDEYIYFATDHHWTALGAYYSYREWAKAKGLTPHELNEYEKQSYPGFIGSYYASTQSQVLKDNPDTIEAYVPLTTNRMQFTQEDGVTLNWNIVNDVSGYTAGNKYSCFSGGDNPYSIIQNPKISDGSSCVVIKESFGNALIPFLADHYQTIHIIDYRYYKGNIIDFVKKNHVQDVLFANNIEAISGENIMNKLSSITQ